MEEQTALTIWESPEKLEARIKRMLEIQQNVMRPDVDYGIIPGCQKPSLYKPGAELLMVTFGLSDRIDVEELSEDGDEIRYRVKTEIYSQGLYLGCGVGEASTNEDKYKWRKMVCEKEYEAAPIDERREKWFKGYQGKEPYAQKQIRTNPSDVANTVLKMAKKRSKIDGVLSVLAASRIYTQDLEDMSKELQDMLTDEEREKRKSSKPDITQDTEVTERPNDEQRKASKQISEGQEKRIYAICKANKVDVEKLKSWLLDTKKITHLYQITWQGGQYESICKAIESSPGTINNYVPKKQPEPVEGETKKDEPATKEKKAETPEVTDNKFTMGKDEFESQIRTLGLQFGLNNIDDVNKFLVEQTAGKIDRIDNIPEKEYSGMIDLFNFWADKEDDK